MYRERWSSNQASWVSAHSTLKPQTAGRIREDADDPHSPLDLLVESFE